MASRAALRTTCSPTRVCDPTQQSSDASVFQMRSMAWSVAIDLNVFLDAIGGAAQRELAQRHEIALAEEISRRALDLLGHVDLARLEALQQLVGGHVDQHDVVGLVEKRIGNGFPHPDAGDAADDVVQALQMLDVERREDIDTACEQFVDVLPALRMPRARRVGVRQLVDQDQCGMARERGIEIEFLDRCALDIERSGGRLLETISNAAVSRGRAFPGPPITTSRFRARSVCARAASRRSCRRRPTRRRRSSGGRVPRGFLALTLARSWSGSGRCLHA